MSTLFHAEPLVLRDSGTGVSLFRLYALRVLYLLIAAVLGFRIWPEIVHHAEAWTLEQGVVKSMFATLPVLAVLGIRYPLKLLPLLFFELVWKSIWLIAVAYPLWTRRQIDADTAATVKDCLLGVIIPAIAIPWPYVFANYVKSSGDRWR